MTAPIDTSPPPAPPDAATEELPAVHDLDDVMGDDEDLDDDGDDESGPMTMVYATIHLPDDTMRNDQVSVPGDVDTDQLADMLLSVVRGVAAQHSTELGLQVAERIRDR